MPDTPVPHPTMHISGSSLPQSAACVCSDLTSYLTLPALGLLACLSCTCPSQALWIKIALSSLPKLSTGFPIGTVPRLGFRGPGQVIGTKAPSTAGLPLIRVLTGGWYPKAQAPATALSDSLPGRYSQAAERAVPEHQVSPHLSLW